MTQEELLEAVAKAIHRVWARHTIRIRESESEDDAHERRWEEMKPKAKGQFRDMAQAAIMVGQMVERGIRR